MYEAISENDKVIELRKVDSPTFSIKHNVIIAYNIDTVSSVHGLYKIPVTNKSYKILKDKIVFINDDTVTQLEKEVPKAFVSYVRDYNQTEYITNYLDKTISPHTLKVITSIEVLYETYYYYLHVNRYKLYNLEKVYNDIVRLEKVKEIKLL